MAADLASNEFWKKKITTELRVNDLNKDGFISRADLDLTYQHYKDLGASDQHLAKIKDYFDEISELIGVADPNTKLTYEEVADNMAKAAGKFDEFVKLFEVYFKIIDSNENGKISYKEWEDYYRVLNIDTVHARASFDAMDTNSDGVVSREEFLAYNKEFYFSAEDKLKSSILYGPLD